MEAISKDIKDGKVLGNSQSEFARGDDQPDSPLRLGGWQLDKGRAGHIVYFDFSKAFYSILIAKLVRHGQETWTIG